MKLGKTVMGLGAVAVAVLWMASISLQAATHTVLVGTYFFNPTNISVFQGDTIIWTNRSTISHDSTHGALSTPDSQRLWKSPNLPAVNGNYRFTFTNAGFYPYICLQHIEMRPQQTGTVTVVGGNIPPSVALTAPGSGTRHPVPANFAASATASDLDGVVTNVAFTAFNAAQGTLLLGAAAAPPYSIQVTNLTPATYQLRAIATDDGGSSTTSSVVSVQLVMPVPLELTAPGTNALGQFQFDMATSFGLRYVVEESIGLGGAWTGVSTNTAPGASVRILRPFDVSSPTQRLYRAFIEP